MIEVEDIKMKKRETMKVTKMEALNLKFDGDSKTN